MSATATQKKTAPQEIILTGRVGDPGFVIKTAAGVKVFEITGDGKIAYNNATAGAQAAAVTAPVVAASAFTHTAPSADDFAFQGITSSTPFGFVNANEGNSLLKTVQNLLKRQEEIIAALQNVGIIAA